MIWGLLVRKNSTIFNCVRKMSNANASKDVILLACGSFNPVTHMHLRMFELARDHLREFHPDINITNGFISPVSDGYGKKGLASCDHRINMCNLALADSNWVKTMDWESRKANWTPTIEVIGHFHTTENKRVILLCGSDYLQSFSIKGLWKERNIKSIISDHGLIVVTRPDYDSQSIIQSSQLLSSLSSNIIIINDPINNDLSSTKVRELVQKGKTIKYLTPPSVVNYINKHRLYLEIPEEPINELAPFKYNRETSI